MDVFGFIDKAIASDRLSHAYIFYGDGDGPADIALYTAKGANCLAVSGKPCGKCSSCRKIERFNHPDVLVTGTSGSTVSIDDIRRMQRDIFMKPYEGRKRVSIIHRGENMTLQAQNCILKVLEEPPGTGIIIITAANPANLLPTILSRCQILKVDHKKRIPEIEPFRNVLECIFEGNFIRASEEIALLLKDGETSPEEFMDLLFLLLRDILMLKVAQNKNLLYIKNGDGFAENVSAKFTPDKLGRALDTVSETIEHLKYNVNAQLVLETLVLEIQEVLQC